jgi:aminoglycoside 6-adenylyltransferase
VCFISVETVPKVAAKAAKFLGKTFGTFLLSTRLKHTQGLWRNELTNAKHIQDVYVREQLMKMLVWYFGIKTNFQKAAGKSGKYIRGNVESEVWVELEKTYSDADFEHIWESLFAMGDLFRQLAKSVANHFGFQYHQQEDDNVSDYLRRIKKLPKDAKEI